MKYLKLFEQHTLYNRLPNGFKIVSVDDSNEICIIDSDINLLSCLQYNELNDGVCYVSGVASNLSGMGTLVYEFAMMSLYPNGLMPSRDGDVRGGAYNIWERFYNRGDIEKQTLDISDDKYNISILTGEDYNMTHDEKLEFFNSGVDDSEINVLNIFNTIYKIKPSKKYTKNIISIGELPSTDIEKLKTQLKYFFSNLYD